MSFPLGQFCMQISLPSLRLSRGPLRPSRIMKTLAGKVPFPPPMWAFSYWRLGLEPSVCPWIHPSRALVLATLPVRLSCTLQKARFFHCWIALNANLAVEANSWRMTPALLLVLVSLRPRHLQRLRPVPVSFSPLYLQRLRLSSLCAASVRRRMRRSFWMRAKGALLLVVLWTMVTW